MHTPSWPCSNRFNASRIARSGRRSLLAFTAIGKLSRAKAMVLLQLVGIHVRLIQNLLVVLNVLCKNERYSILMITTIFSRITLCVLFYKSNSQSKHMNQGAFAMMLDIIVWHSFYEVSPNLSAMTQGQAGSVLVGYMLDKGSTRVGFPNTSWKTWMGQLAGQIYWGNFGRSLGYTL